MLHSLNTEIAIDHFTACFVLHNFMILNGEKLLVSCRDFDLNKSEVAQHVTLPFLQDLDDPTATFVQDDDEEDDDDDEEEEDEDRRDDDEVPDANMNVLLRRARARGQRKRNNLVIEIANNLNIQSLNSG